MKALIAVLLVVTSLLSVGCSSVKTKVLAPNTAGAFSGKSLVLSKYNELPDFPAQTAVNVQFGVVGVLTAISNGNAIIRRNNIQDPALGISRQLAQGMQNSHGFNVTEADDFVTVKSDVPELAARYQDYDYVLDVKTLGWSSIYFPTDWDNYRVIYTAHARLISVDSGQVVAEQLCSHVPDYADTNQAPSYVQLENGTGLKATLNKSIEYCVDHIRATAQLYNEGQTENVAVAE
ncbi:hypothetical protein SAMN05216271_0179 [Halopseudomonas sabulinigri]|uniref:Lipoprotein n=1 Tax=Halopseudomonas sabulinigri TaxID=472181 RepID=A0A1H1LF38_9GAMM|nr:hypothetical protein [Halopseudomonas sabulinigri]SDR72489.1 hypothetical protein SAMN05216271_0179 [Halopseudomonas sabulinigri]